MEGYVYYGKGKLPFKLPTRWNIIGQGEPSGVKKCADVNEEVIRALDHPIGAPRIEAMAKPGKTVILFDDMTRQTPAYLVFPEILKRLNSAGVKDKDVTAICALGTHPKITEKQIIQKIGREIYERLSPRVVVHDANSKKNIVIGRTTYGSLVEINPLVMEAEFTLGIGWCTPHLSSGFGGGSKIVMPGVSSSRSILEHHIKWMANPKATLGIVEGNPFHKEQDEVGRMAGVQYKVDVAMDVRNDVTKIYAGDLCEVTRVASQDLLKVHGVSIKHKADVVIAGSYPLDSVAKALGSAAPVTKSGGCIIVVGSKSFPSPEHLKSLIPAFNNGKSFAEEVRDLIEGRINETVWSAGISAWTFVLFMKKYLETFKVTYVCEGMSSSDVQAIHMTYSRTIEEALERIENEVPEADVTIFPAGSITIPILSDS
jgi:nickel-dependent lactate racemase